LERSGPQSGHAIKSNPCQAGSVAARAGRHLVALAAGDAVRSQPTPEFLARADAAVGSGEAPLGGDPRSGGGGGGGAAPAGALPSPALPHGYARVAQHCLARGLARRQLAMCASLMALHAARNPRLQGRRHVACRPPCTLLLDSAATSTSMSQEVSALRDIVQL